MCSVVGYIGSSQCQSFVMEGLRRLEYRGYDSAGFAVLDSDSRSILSQKAVGRLSNLADSLKLNPIDGFLGIGHTRWATHGASSTLNAHPHFDCRKEISLVHNGIIENHHELKDQLKLTGHIFESQTDTEVIAHFFEQSIAQHLDIKSALVDLVNQLHGAYAFLAILKQFPDCLIMVRRRSPLCIGVGNHEMFAASDLLAFAGRSSQVCFLPDESFAILSKDKVELYDFAGNALPVHVQEVVADWSDAGTGGHAHYMLKEIYEQKSVIQKTVAALQASSDGIWEQLGVTPEYIQKLDKINMVGCGTSWHAARIAQFYFESICMMPASVYLASEFKHMPFFPQQNSLYLAISQSGETADTLETLRLINSMNLHTIALTNVPSSTMVREAKGFLLTHAGREVAVASTKAFSTQLTALYWFAHRIALAKGIIGAREMQQAYDDILIAAQVLENTIESYKYEIMHTLATKYAKYDKAIFLGRHISYPFAMEAALKLKEITYIFSQCYPAGELKHGPLALVDENIPVFVFSVLDPVVYQKIVSNAQEAKARGGHLVVFAFAGQDELCALADQAFIIPKIKPLLAPLAMTGIMQFFAYSVANALNLPIDKPRNLAKSVTVE